MMPPHLSGEPTLTGNTLVLQGYSLNYTDPDSELSVVDVDSGEALLFAATVEQVRQDRSGGAANPPPGSIQYRCILTAKLQGVELGQTYRVSFVDEVFEVTAR